MKRKILIARYVSDVQHNFSQTLELGAYYVLKRECSGHFYVIPGSTKKGKLKFLRCLEKDGHPCGFIVCFEFDDEIKLSTILNLLSFSKYYPKIKYDAHAF